MSTPQTFKIDQAATFSMVQLLDCSPKAKFGSDHEQEMTRDGRGKYEAQVTAGFKAFGKTEFAVIKVGLIGERNPAEGISPGTPVELVGFEVGVMDKQVRDRESGETRTVGAQVYYRAESIRSIVDTAPRKTASTGTSSSSTGEAAA